MKNRFINYLAATTLALSLVASPALALADATITPTTTDETQACYALTLTSNTLTQTAGFTEILQAGPTTALLPASYSGGSFANSTLTQTVIPPWIDPATDVNYTGASWISSNATWPGGVDNAEGAAANDQWRLFHDTFTIPAGAVVSSATLMYAADNATDVYQNGNTTPISTTGDTYGTTPVAGPANYANTMTVPMTIGVGTHTLDFVVRNWSSDSATNPTGLLYKATINYCVPVTPPPATVMVHINKFIDGAQATTLTANSASFPMSATWSATNIGSGTGTYALDTTDSYATQTIAMTSGADYTTNEDASGATVGTTCAAGPFALVGYTTGTTLALAAAATPTMTVPTFTNITADKYVIVWNHDCANSSGTIGGTVSGGISGTGVLTVTSVTPTDTAGTADNTYENGMIYTFNITVPTNEQNLKMKFSDWTQILPASTFAAGGNMRISSAQADNAGATVPIATANVYSTPALHMTGDLDPLTPGLQVQVKVEVKIPVGTVNGSYTTNYGVQTLP